MPRGRPQSWYSDQSDGPVIIEREPDVRTARSTSRQRPKKLTFDFKFLNPFKSRKPSARIVHQQVHRRRRRPHRPEFVGVRERVWEPRRSGESTPMSRDRPRNEFIPLPPRIPIHNQELDPIIEIVTPRQRRRPEVHQPRRNSFDPSMNNPPVRVFEPERISERERDRRRDAERFARQEARRRREAEEGRMTAEEEAERVHRAAVRERERRRQVEDITQRIGRVAINERENRREAEEEARRLAAEAQDAEARARQAEYALARERQFAERERAVRERQRRAEMEDRAEAEALLNRRRSVHVVQRDLPLVVDRGAEVLRRAQEEEHRRRENDDLLYRMERDRHRGLPRRQRSITIFEDDEDRRRHRRS